MNYKGTINKGIALGTFLLLIMSVGGWFLIPTPEAYSDAYWQKWLFLYSVPLSAGVSVLVLKRYGNEDLIKGYLSAQEGIEIERAYLQNTVEQTVIALPLIASFGALATTPSLLKIIPLHAVIFIVGRMLFWFGYKRSYSARIPGFVITNYANIALFVGCLYLLFNA